MLYLDLIHSVLKGVISVWNWVKNALADVKIWKWKPFAFLKGSAPASNDEGTEENKDPGFIARVNELLDRINSGVLWIQIAAAVDN